MTQYNLHVQTVFLPKMVLLKAKGERSCIYFRTCECYLVIVKALALSCVKITFRIFSVCLALDTATIVI